MNNFRLNQLLDEVPKQEDVEVKEEFKPPIKLPLTEIMGKEGAFEMTKTINNKTTVSSKRNTKSKNEGNKANGVINEEISHKLTEYFPVRRSVRKTKKEVLEEKQKDLEMAIREEREDGLTVCVMLIN